MKTIRGVTIGDSFPAATKEPFKIKGGSINCQHNYCFSYTKKKFKLFDLTDQLFQPPSFQAGSLRLEGSQPALKFAQEIAYNLDLLSLLCRKITRTENQK